MTTEYNTPPGPPPGHYVAPDGQYHPVPPGHVLGADGLIYPVAQAPGAPVAQASAWSWNLASLLIVGGAAVVAVGAFMPWASVGPFSAAGTDGDGILTLILALGAGPLGAFGILKSKKGLLIGSLICAALILAIAAYDTANISSVADGPFGLTPEVGGGLYLTLIGAVAGIVGPVLAMRRRPA